MLGNGRQRCLGRRKTQRTCSWQARIQSHVSHANRGQVTNQSKHEMRLIVRAHENRRQEQPVKALGSSCYRLAGSNGH